MESAHDPNDIEHLFKDFSASLDCEVTGQLWVAPDGPMEGIPHVGKCPNQAVSWVGWRACPCAADIRTWQKMNPGVPVTHGPKVEGGLAVIGLPMCQDHIHYFVNYLRYPFTCPGCGVTFLQPGEMLISGDDL